MSTAAIIVAAGRGRRVGGALPKQWRDLAGRTVTAHALEAFLGHPRIDRIVLVLHADDMGLAPGYEGHPGLLVVPGGASRAASVRAGLEALEGSDVARVLIHDVARPLVSAALISRVCAALEHAQGAAPALALSDALWRGEGGTVAGVVARDGLFRAQTPQGFRFSAILAAHRACRTEPADDVEVARAAGIEVAIVEGEERNLKITTEDDFARAGMYLAAGAARLETGPQTGPQTRENTGPQTGPQTREQPMDIRTGNGFDVHGFGAGDHVTLCGVRIPHEHGLAGHSDADVGMHALCDALYGALGEGDIGRHFPPDEARWQGADSAIFLEHAVARAAMRGFRLGNADVTLICERPKIGPHAEAMIARLAGIMGVEAGRVSVKATTSERLGFTGRGEGIAALATATLVAP